MTDTSFNRKPTEFVAMRLDTKEIMWKKTMGYKNSGDHLLLHDDIIYIMGRKVVSAYKLSNGENVYSRFFPDSIFDDDYYAPDSSVGIVMYNNRFYYTNSNYYAKGKAPNIVCLESSDGSTVWGRLAYRSVSLGATPAVANGKVFLPLHEGFHVLDAETGELLGIDKNICGEGSLSTTFQYNNMMIFPKEESHGFYRYIAVNIR
jgi:outer membrane protein assembly factor BamB